MYQELIEQRFNDTVNLRPKWKKKKNTFWLLVK